MKDLFPKSPSYNFLKKFNPTKKIVGSLAVVFSFWVFFKRILVAFLIANAFVCFSLVYFKLPALRQFAVWLVVGVLFFWLISGFNHFLKRYRFGKYTTAVQRFWKRALSCFWVIEGFLFSIFLYLILNASGEPKFFADHVVDEKLHLTPSTQFLLNSFCIVVLINITVYLTVLIKFKTLRQLVPYLLSITFLLSYIFLKEAYQMYFIVTWYEDFFWVISDVTNTWELEKDTPRMRDRNHFLTLLVVAKFWHYVFVFVSWVFFFTKSIEQRRVRYALFSMCFQNFILFYAINWVCTYAWFKWFFRKFGDQTYFWFLTSIRGEHLVIVCNDILSLLQNFVGLFNLSPKLTYFNLHPTFYGVLPTEYAHEYENSIDPSMLKLFRSKMWSV